MSAHAARPRPAAPTTGGPDANLDEAVPTVRCTDEPSIRVVVPTWYGQTTILETTSAVDAYYTARNAPGARISAIGSAS